MVRPARKRPARPGLTGLYLARLHLAVFHLARQRLALNARTAAQLARRRQWVFAACMSFLSVNLVSLIVLSRSARPLAELAARWWTQMCISWPLIFACILWGAPWVMRFTHWLVPSVDTMDVPQASKPQSD